MKKLIILCLLVMTCASAFAGCNSSKESAKQVSPEATSMVADIEKVTTEVPVEENVTTEVPENNPNDKPIDRPEEGPTENVVEIVNRMFKNADEYYQQKDGRCQDILDEIELNYPEYADKVEERRNYYMEYPDGTVLLLFEEPFDYTYIYGPFYKYDTKGCFEDNYGNVYYDYAKAIMSGTNLGENDKYVVYNSEGKYDTFEGQIVCYKEVDEINEFHAEVYGDGELIYTSETINGYSKPLTFTADISGYELIKVCLVREDDYLTIAKQQPSVALVDAKFYNQVLPEFIPFEPIEE